MLTARTDAFRDFLIANQRSKLFFILALLLMITSPKYLHAAEGILNSISFASVPHGASVHIESFDDSDDSVQILQAFEAAIKAAGYVPANNAKLLLIFEARIDIGGFSTRSRRYIFSLETMSNKLGKGQESHAKVNVFNSNTGGLLNKGRGTTTITTPSTYEINAAIEDRDTGKTLWQGWVSTKLPNKIGMEYPKLMVPKIVGAIGKTVRQGNFSLY